MTGKRSRSERYPSLDSLPARVYDAFEQLTSFISGHPAFLRDAGYSILKHQVGERMGATRFLQQIAKPEAVCMKHMENLMDFFSRGFQNEEAIDIPLVVLEDYFDPVPHRFRLILIQSGTGIITIDDIKTHFFAPCILCVSDDVQTISYKTEMKIHTLETVFHPLFINPDYGQVDSEVLWIQAFIKRSRDYFGLIQLDVLSFHRIGGLMATLKQVLNQTGDEFWPCRARSYLLESLLIVDRLYLKQFEEEKSQPGFGHIHLPEASPLVNELLDYLHTHYEEEISLDFLSRISHVNRTTLNQIFKQTMGIPITQYLIELRMQVAKVMLTNTMLNVSEIMLRAGFTDLPHFNRTFKQRVGMTPSKFREEHSCV